MDDIQTQFDNHNHDGQNSKRITQTVFVSKSLEGTAPATSANYGVFFIATRPCVIIAISEAHTVIGSDAGAVTVTLERLTSGVALDSGTVLLATAFDLKATVNVEHRGVLARIPVGLSRGDRLALKDAGVLTAVAGLVVTVTLAFQ